MKLIKFPLKVLVLPIIAALCLAYLLAKAITHISCYILGPFMLFIGIILVVMFTKSRWTDVGICGGIEVACLIALFGAAWIIVHIEDINSALIRFVQS
ncbi:MAG: hypothetical protein K6E32_07870 [Lachnospiraceae bacterium]|nr:hypothetical protein [Lachnospiraceae bacterium]